MGQYHEITCQSACNRLKRKTPYRWDLNIYRGCAHGCCYCYALGSHKYVGDGTDFYRDIYVKTNIVEQLERQLSAPDWQREVVNIGGVTDSYQPAEAQYRLMPEILRLLIRYKTPAIISTKSALVLRDYDLIDELSHITYVNIAETITTMDEGLRGKLEPGAAPSAKRFEVLRAFRETRASVGLHLMPIIPHLTDSRENMDALLQNARDCRVHYVLPGMLYLRGETRQAFLSFVQREFPALHAEMVTLYKTGGAERHYKNGFYEMFNALRKQYGLSNSYTKPMQERLQRVEDPQISLFDGI
ncbi:radical SAM protein [Intestinibacillus massiliensis]|nr:radical SAM protein [Intestinibacillus massiliensis]